jgi:hypothetical protein
MGFNMRELVTIFMALLVLGVICGLALRREYKRRNRNHNHDRIDRIESRLERLERQLDRSDERIAQKDSAAK